MDIIILGFATAFFVVLLATPSLIKVAKLKHLVDEPSEDRKMHHRSVPTMGGIIIFAGAIFSYCLWFPTEDRNYFLTDELLARSFDVFKYLLAGLFLLFFIGVKDDIIGTAPVKKLIGHILVAFILVLMADIRITNMHGIFGFHEIPEWTSIFLSAFTYIVIVNAFNLIDGLDGLAAGIALICTLFFGAWFYFAGNIPLALLCASCGGALLAFLIFNFAPAKVFMGDSGSLVVGAIMSVLAILLIEHDTSQLPDFLSKIPTPVVAMGILAYPLVDTIRVFIYRAVKGGSPFQADNNHIHHRWVKLGMNHSKTALILYFLSILVCLLGMFTGALPPTWAFVLMFTAAILIFHIPFLIKPKAMQ